jgi:hypothetical protein
MVFAALIVHRFLRHFRLENQLKQENWLCGEKFKKLPFADLGWLFRF